MLKAIERGLLRSLKAAGILRLVRDSEWRRQRLLILCYHSLALHDEHQWRPAAFMPPEMFEQRLRMLREGNYNVLSLSEGLRRLYANELPPRSVVLTFDDGTYDFYKAAYPLLIKYGYPATVYQTTYYVAHRRPVCNLVCSYILWRSRQKETINAKALGLAQPLDLRTEASRQKIADQLMQNQTEEQKHRLVAQLAELLDFDYEELLTKRILQLMNSAEILELSQNGIDFQLHTHRHRAPREPSLFRKEIHENRESLRQITGSSAQHFCYPLGVYGAEFLPWLQQEGIVSGTTCDAGLASRRSHSLLLPRFVDTSAKSPLEFEGWLGGVGALLLKARGGPERKAL